MRPYFIHIGLELYISELERCLSPAWTAAISSVDSLQSDSGFPCWGVGMLRGKHGHQLTSGRAWSGSVRPRTACSTPLPPSARSLPQPLASQSPVLPLALQAAEYRGKNAGCVAESPALVKEHFVFFPLKGQGGRGQSIKLHKAAVLAGSSSNSIWKTLQTA